MTVEQAETQPRVVVPIEEDLPSALACIVLFSEKTAIFLYTVFTYDLIMVYLLTAIWLRTGGSSTVHIYTQTVDITTQLTTLLGRVSGTRTQTGQNNWEECRPCPVFASYTVVFALQLRKKHGKISVSVAEECQLAQ
jgi:hypothetical protein